MRRTLFVWGGIGLIAALLALVGIVSTAGLCLAQTRADLRAGAYADMGGVALGAGLVSPLASEPSWSFNPNFEAAFADRRNEITLNADFTYALAGPSSVVPYLGAGPALLMRHADGGDTRTDAGLNLIGGFASPQGEVRPFVQVKGILSSDSEVGLIGGVRF